MGKQRVRAALVPCPASDADALLLVRGVDTAAAFFVTVGFGDSRLPPLDPRLAESSRDVPLSIFPGAPVDSFTVLLVLLSAFCGAAAAFETLVG